MKMEMTRPATRIELAERVDELQEENIKLRNENKDLKDKLEIQGNLTETYFKIAELLAFTLSNKDASNTEYCKGNLDNCEERERCTQCIIDWARKEVEKGE